MKTYPEYDPQIGQMVAFEIDSIDNSHIILPKIIKILKQNPNVSKVRRTGFFSRYFDILVRFNYYEKPFVVWQEPGGLPFYWIGPYNNEDSISIQDLEELFKKTNISIYYFLYNIILAIFLIFAFVFIIKEIFINL
ncbi:hypothetical protein CUZ56_00323 [Saezia sanguinis]|uniref:Uncharacterized protein n=1 Tax=Saezia sanguinis TaxID=1965230 RepID=A0A433SGG9_9BURK|nr:hypothetical protein [Saezia sanguinis]RUS67843.1 hypothetical protein CUZ56_00323 [Saezia sanguinis]